MFVTFFPIAPEGEWPTEICLVPLRKEVWGKKQSKQKDENVVK